MSNATANAIIEGSSNGTSSSSATAFNVTRMRGAKAYSQAPPSSPKEMMGSKVGSVQASRTVIAQVRAHGVAMLRLRAQKMRVICERSGEKGLQLASFRPRVSRKRHTTEVTKFLTKSHS